MMNEHRITVDDFRERLAAYVETTWELIEARSARRIAAGQGGRHG